MQNFTFILKRDYETKPYYWHEWEDGKIIKTTQAEILAFYKVYINDDLSKGYSFEIRKDEAGRTIFDSDDELKEYLYSQKKSMKEVNEICNLIFEEMDKEYFGAK